MVWRGDLGIWLATSEDMKVWTNVQDDPVIRLGPEEYDKEQVADFALWKAYDAEADGENYWEIEVSIG